MRFLKAITITSILSTAAAAPTTTTGTPTRIDTISKRNHEDKCKGSTFINQSSGGSPWVIDCQHLAYNIRKGGTWTLNAARTRQLAQYGSCAFGAQGDPMKITVGNGDIIDVINDSISRFQTADGKVGAKGTFDCSTVDVAGDGYSPVDWGIYST